MKKKAEATIEEESMDIVCQRLDNDDQCGHCPKCKVNRTGRDAGWLYIDSGTSLGWMEFSHSICCAECGTTLVAPKRVKPKAAAS